MPDLPSFFYFGSILTIGIPDLILLGSLCFITTILFVFFYQTIICVAFDPIFAKSQRLPVQTIEYILMILIAMAIVSTLRMVGIVLAMSLLTIPQMTANIIYLQFQANDLFKYCIWLVRLLDRS